MCCFLFRFTSNASSGCVKSVEHNNRDLMIWLIRYDQLEEEPWEWYGFWNSLCARVQVIFCWLSHLGHNQWAQGSIAFLGHIKALSFDLLLLFQVWSTSIPRLVPCCSRAFEVRYNISLFCVIVPTVDDAFLAMRRVWYCFRGFNLLGNSARWYSYC